MAAMTSIAAKTSADAGRAWDPGDRIRCGADPATTKTTSRSNISNSLGSESPVRASDEDE